MSLTTNIFQRKKERIADTEENHRSRSNFSKSLSGLTSDLYTSEQRILINDLMKKNEWIEEEGNDIEKIIVGHCPLKCVNLKNGLG